MFEFGDRVEFDHDNKTRTGLVYSVHRTGWITVLSNDEQPGKFYEVHPDAVRKV
jgi:hypothetical protein